MSSSEHVSVPVVSMARKPVGTVEVPAAVVAGPTREHLLHDMVKSQLAARRAGSSSTKTRSTIRGGGSKPWRQKGTGRARAGSMRSPLWEGGAVIFGPQPRSYAYRLPRSARRAALMAVLAVRHGEERLLVVDRFTLPAPKTKELVGCLQGLGVEGGALIVVPEIDEGLARAARNLPHTKVLAAAGLNVHDVLRYETLILTRDALELVVARLAGGAESGAER